MLFTLHQIEEKNIVPSTNSATEAKPRKETPYLGTKSPLTTKSCLAFRFIIAKKQKQKN